MDRKSIERKFSRHIGRILTKLEEPPCASDDAMEYTKGELWLLCNDLILMLGMEENDRLDKNS